MRISQTFFLIYSLLFFIFFGQSNGFSFFGKKLFDKGSVADIADNGTAKETTVNPDEGTLKMTTEPEEVTTKSGGFFSFFKKKDVTEAPAANATDETVVATPAPEEASTKKVTPVETKSELEAERLEAKKKKSRLFHSGNSLRVFATGILDPLKIMNNGFQLIAKTLDINDKKNLLAKLIVPAIQQLINETMEMAGLSIVKDFFYRTHFMKGLSYDGLIDYISAKNDAGGDATKRAAFLTQVGARLVEEGSNLILGFADLTVFPIPAYLLTLFADKSPSGLAGVGASIAIRIHGIKKSAKKLVSVILGGNW